MATLSVSNNQYWVRCSDGQWYENPWIYAELGSCTATVDGDDWIVTATVWVKTTANSGADITVYSEQIFKTWISYGDTNSDVVEMKSARYSGPTSAAFDSIKFRIKGSEASTMGFIIHVDTSSIIGTNYSKGIYWKSKGINILELYTSTTTSGLPPIYKAPSWGEFYVLRNSTKSISVWVKWTNGNKYSTAYVGLYATDMSGAGTEIQQKTTRTSTTIVFDNLEHNKIYYVNAYLNDTADGGKTAKMWFNPSINLQANTKKLSVVNTSIIPHQYSIASTWKSQIDDKDDTTGITFSSYKCYLTSDTSKLSVGNTTSNVTDNSPNRTNTTTGLISYTNYSLYYAVTDGYNVVGITVNTKTIYPYARIFVNGEWKKAMVYIYDGSTWKLTKGNVFDGTSFKEFNGE